VTTQLHFHVVTPQFKGQWKDDTKHGKGKMNSATGDQYTGDWLHDSKTGEGVCVYANGDRYQ
jgi:hypothetical protein